MYTPQGQPNPAHQQWCALLSLTGVCAPFLHLYHAEPTSASSLRGLLAWDSCPPHLLIDLDPMKRNSQTRMKPPVQPLAHQQYRAMLASTAWPLESFAVHRRHKRKP